MELLCSCAFSCCAIALFVLFLLCIKQTLTVVEIIPNLYYKESDLTNYLLTHCKSLKMSFRPRKFISHCYTQTLLGYFRSPAKDVMFTREYIQLEDKGIIALDWLKDSKTRKGSPILIVFPRMTGDSISVSEICVSAARKGFRVVVFNRRGHGSSYLATPKLTSPGDPNDVKQALEYISMKFPNVYITGVGIGNGCALVFSYLGEYGSASLLKAAACVSPSYDNTDSLSNNIPKFYEFLLLYKLKKMILSHSKALEKVINIPKIIRTWSLKEFDYYVYCKMYGLDTFQTFWEENDPMRDVDDIAIPVLCVNSLDDPVTRKDNISLDLFKFYPNLLLLTLDNGGHCGFMEEFGKPSWANQVIIDFLDNVLCFIAKSRPLVENYRRNNYKMSF